MGLPWVTLLYAGELKVLVGCTWNRTTVTLGRPGGVRKALKKLLKIRILSGSIKAEPLNGDSGTVLKFKLFKNA